MILTEVTDIRMEGLEPYWQLTTGGLRGASAGDLIIVESPKVIERALDAGLEPVSLLCERRHLQGDASTLLKRMGEIPVFTGERDLLAGLTGYALTRGVLCAMRRPSPPSLRQLMQGARRLCVIYDVCDATNVGVMFRTAAALGYDGVLLSEGTCDPLNRRAIRVSMGGVFQIPWRAEADVMGALVRGGFRSVSMALSRHSIFLQDFVAGEGEKYAVVLGSEGYGLPAEVIEASDYVVKIPINPAVDSLNVGAAAAIALWHMQPSGSLGR